MATVAGDIYINIAADFARFRDDIVKIGKLTADQVGGMKGALESIADSVEAARTGFEGMIAALGVKELANFVTEAIEATAKIKDQADAAGLTTQAYQALQYAASQTGTSQEQLTTGLDHMTRVLGDAAGGSKQAQAAFTNIGVSIRDANGNVKASQTIFHDVAQAISEVPSQAQRAAAEVALFGKTGQQLGSMFEDGAAGLDSFAVEAQGLGLIFDNSMIKQAQEAQAKLQGLSLEFDAMADRLAVKVIPYLEHFLADLEKIPMFAPDAALAATNDKLDELTKTLAAQRAQLEQSQWAEDHYLGWLTAAGTSTDALKKKIAETSAAIQDQQEIAKILQLGHQGQPTSVFQGPSTPSSAFASGSTGKSQAEKDAEAYKATTAALQAEIAALSGDSEAIKLNSALREAHAKAGSVEAANITALVGQLQAEKDAQADLKIEVAAETAERAKAKSIIEGTMPAQDKYNQQIDELQKLYAEGYLSLTQFDNATLDYKKQLEDADPALKQAAEDQKELQSSIEDAAGALLNDLGRAFTDSGNAADRWKNLVSHAIQDVMGAFEGLLKKLLGAGLDSLFGGAGGATLGSILGIGGGGAGAILGPLAGAPAIMGGGGGLGIGDWAIVGERGPELVYADTPGNVLSADRTRGVFASGNSPSGDTHFHIDARGADMAAVARMEMALKDMHRTFEQRAVAAVSGQRKRGGTFAATFSR